MDYLDFYGAADFLTEDDLLPPLTYNGKVYGASAPKAGVTLHGVDYIVKRPKKGYNNVHCEYLTSNMIKVLGGNVQETMLDIDNDGTEVVLCRDFTQDNKGVLRSLWEIDESSVDTDTSNHDYFYEDIIYVIKHLTKCDPEEFTKRFLEMYVFDTIFANPDRHPGNWGIYNNQLAPIYDNDACLFPRANINDFSKEWLETRIKEFPNSKIMFNGKRERSSYYHIWREYSLPDYAYEFGNSLDINKALEFLSSNPFLSEQEKQFYINVVYNRYRCIIRREKDICLM